MTELFAELLRDLSLRERATAAVDILVVAYVIYRVLLLLRGTRAAQMLLGLTLVAGGFFVAKGLELTTLSWLLDNLINYSIIFLIIIFQYDIRRGLVGVGRNLFGSGRHYEETYVFEEVIRAAEQLARVRVGALIVFEREASLEEFIGEPGEMIDARVSKELLISLFLPLPVNTLHDGAVVIKNLRVHRAGCVLPLSANPKLDKSLGTRHRAAIGITEETDAVVVVVSEERGAASLCFGGNIALDLDPATLRKALLGLFQKARTDPQRASSAPRRRSAPEAAAPAAAPPSRPPHRAPGAVAESPAILSVGEEAPTIAAEASPDA